MRLSSGSGVILKSNPCVGCEEHCCVGEYATFVTFGDVKRISEFTGLEPDVFCVYAPICSDKKGQKELLKEKDHAYFGYGSDGDILQLRACKGGECIFLKDMKCSIYASRPLICKIFPVGFKKVNDKVELFIEVEDSHCAFTDIKSVDKIHDCLGRSKEESLKLIEQFLEEVDVYKRFSKNLIKDSVSSVLKNLG